MGPYREGLSKVPNEYGKICVYSYRDPPWNLFCRPYLSYKNDGSVLSLHVYKRRDIYNLSCRPTDSYDTNV